MSYAVVGGGGGGVYCFITLSVSGRDRSKANENPYILFAMVFTRVLRANQAEQPFLAKSLDPT